MQPCYAPVPYNELEDDSLKLFEVPPLLVSLNLWVMPFLTSPFVSKEDRERFGAA